MTALNEHITYATKRSVSYKCEFPPSQYWVIHGRLATAGQPKHTYCEVTPAAKADIPNEVKDLGLEIAL